MSIRKFHHEKKEEHIKKIRKEGICYKIFSEIKLD